MAASTALSQDKNKELSQNAINNLESIQEEIETSNQYFKPIPDKIYFVKIDPQRDKIVPTENERFKDLDGRPIRRYECKVTHVNNAREQTWTVSKTVCLQIIEQLRKGFTVLKVIRRGTDRNTIYMIEGVQ
jgi:hypothetical protein